MKRVRWEVPDEPLPRHPYRDTLLLHAGMALAIVGVAWLTGGGLARAVTFAAGFFVIATAWSWSRWRRRLAAERRTSEAAAGGRPRARGRRNG